MCGYVRISAAAACGSQRCQIPLKLECQAVVGYPAWVPDFSAGQQALSATEQAL